MKRIKTLLVDDSGRFSQVLRILLDDKPAIDVVCVLDSGESCLEFVRQHAVDLIIIDARMPGLDGPQTVQILRKKYPKIKTIICTIWPEKDARIYAKQAGADDYFVKGEPIKVLVKKIHSLFMR